eukprot:9454277-Alexandrium_andersonii.AAC.1
MGPAADLLNLTAAAFELSSMAGPAVSSGFELSSAWTTVQNRTFELSSRAEAKPSSSTQRCVSSTPQGPELRSNLWLLSSTVLELVAAHGLLRP